MRKPLVAIVDYGMGNIFSIKNACEYVGLNVVLSDSTNTLLSADAIILPGVGAFGDAVKVLKERQIFDTLRQLAFKNKPFLAICLGMQLLLDNSCEFGFHEGLSIFSGDVVRFEDQAESGKWSYKIPHVGWSRIRVNKSNKSEFKCPMLLGLDYEYMYFVHSYYVIPKDENIILSTSRYAGIEFCSSFQVGRVFACQFHPERSGKKGLEIYKRFLDEIKLL